MRLLFLLGALLVLSIAHADRASASQMYSAAGSRLYLVNQNSGGSISSMAVPGSITDLAGQGPYVWAVGGDQLIKIRPAAAEVLSTLALSSPVEALAIHPTTSIFIGVSGSDLVEINPVTGNVTVIAPLSPSIAVESITFDNAGILYGVGDNSFFSIDSANAAVNVISDSVPMNSSTGLAVRPEDGTMFLAAIDGAYNLYTIDAATGIRTLVGPTVLRPSGLAFTTVPEPTTWGALVLASVAGLWRFRTARYHQRGT